MRPGEPSSWKVIKFANTGTSELFVYRFSIEIPKLVDATRIFEPQRSRVKEAIAGFVVEGLLQAFERLKEIRLEPSPELNRRQAYNAFMRDLWHAYKDLMPKAASAIGFEIGFLFQKPANFEQGATAFLKVNRAIGSGFIDYLRTQRTSWQNRLAQIRNEYLEHQSLEWKQVMEVYTVPKAEQFFHDTCATCEEILVTLIETKFPDHVGITEIPVSARDPSRPDRFQFILIAKDDEEP